MRMGEIVLGLLGFMQTERKNSNNPNKNPTSQKIILIIYTFLSYIFIKHLHLFLMFYIFV